VVRIILVRLPGQLYRASYARPRPMTSLLLQSLRRLVVARLLCQHHALRKVATPIPAKPHHSIRL